MIRRLPSTPVNAEPDTRPTPDWYLEHLSASAAQFAELLDTGSLDAPVAACPGWDLARLTEHLGQIHRWARFCIERGRSPDADEVAALESFDASRAADWFRSGAADLVASLRVADPAMSTWHPFPVEQTVAFWFRRQAHETTVHRWDAEQAMGVAGTIDAELASDGIDEYFHAVVPRLLGKGRILPSGSFHVHCTDVAGEWLVWNDDGQYRMIRAHQKGDAALRGPAEAILLRLWGRASARTDELSPVGDESVLDAWTSIGGV